MAQRNKKLMKKNRHIGHREHDESDGGDFEVAAKIEHVYVIVARELVRAQNKKKNKSAGFQSMGKKLMDDQFAALHETPDIQTLLFSATLPKLLVEFTRTGLTEPVLICLEVDSKLSELLKLSFFHLRMDDKPALLLHLLRNVATPQEQTVVFVATKHHVEYLRGESLLLSSEGVECAYIYSVLDQTAGKINIGKFFHRKAMVLVVTDVVARGIDIPLLDNVINYNFPPKPSSSCIELVGRVACAGRGGAAYSLVCTDEIPFVFDLHLYLGRPIQLATPDHQQESDGVFGHVPQSILDDEESQLIKTSETLRNSLCIFCDVFGLFEYNCLEKMELERLQIVDCIKDYKAKATIFEIISNSKTNAKGRYHVPVTAQPSTHHTTNQEDSEEEDLQVSTNTLSIHLHGIKLSKSICGGASE
uniref:DEAD (Asp-Glu-Ala-Asp) box polypeptide 54 n=1 Tax=Oncorhynchus tshawytscha TaxID=74940 RepID=A0A8C8FNQ2_ONCTS